MNKETKFEVHIFTKLTGEIKAMTIEEIVDYLVHNEVEELKIKKVENNSTN